MEQLNIILTIISIIVTIVEIIITIIGVVIPIRNERKSKLPALVLSHSIFGGMPNDDKDSQEDTVLYGYFQFQKNFDKRLHNFLLANDSDVNFMTPNFMNLIVESYNKKDYCKNSQYHPTIEINNIIKTFKDNPRFIKLIKEYMAYLNSSRLCLKITNVGQTPAFDLTVDLFEENNSAAKYLNGTLKPDSTKNIIIYYFDKSAEVDYQANGLCWKNENNTVFYLVDEKKYNKIDERLFLITYRDIYNKIHKVYCCSKIDKNEFHNVMGAK